MVIISSSGETKLKYKFKHNVVAFIKYLIKIGKLLILIKNKSGPEIDPWGTSVVIFDSPDL